jgi:GNAT superfamily N-acetyltransferase
MRRYAENTKVPVERSREELERLLRKAGATGFASTWDPERGHDRLVFRLADRMIRIEVLHPQPNDVARKAHRDRAKLTMVLEQEYRRRWRAQVLLAKAKLEIIADGASTVEREFLADMLLPGGETLGEAMAPRLAAAYEEGCMPQLPLLGAG